MTAYRYSPAGAEALIRRVQARTSMTLVAAIGVLCLLLLRLDDLQTPTVIIPAVLVPALIGTFAISNARRSIRRSVLSTEFELDAEALSARSLQARNTILLKELTQIRTLKDGSLVVRTSSIRQTMHLRPELEGFEELVQRLQALAPPSAERVSRGISPQVWCVILPLANILI